MQRHLISVLADRMESIATNSLVSYLKGARILAKHNKKQRTSNIRYIRITNFFQPKARVRRDPKEDKSKLGPDEP
jgi:hypothetical protein